MTWTGAAINHEEGTEAMSDMILFGPDGRPLNASHVVTRHRFAKAEPVRRRSHRHAEMRWYCLCGAMGPFLIRPADASVSRCVHEAHETCWRYQYREGHLVFADRLVVRGHFETDARWAIAGRGVRSLFGDA